MLNSLVSNLPDNLALHKPDLDNIPFLAAKISQPQRLAIPDLAVDSENADHIVGAGFLAMLDPYNSHVDVPLEGLLDADPVPIVVQDSHLVL